MRCFEMRCFVVSMVAVAALIAFAASPVSATIVEYTDETDFEAELQSYYQEWFHDYNSTEQVSSPQAFASGSYSYTISSPPGLYSLVWPEAGAMSTDWPPDDGLLFTPTGSSVTAAGGYFFGTNESGDFVEDTITVTVLLDDSSTESYTTGASSGDFRGYISTSSPITSLAVSSTGDPIYPTVDGFIVGTPVPEPGTLALLAAGLAGLLCYAWRKKK